METADDERLGPARRCTCGARAVCVKVTWDAEKHGGGAHAGSKEMSYRCTQCALTFELDSVGGTVSSGVFAIGAATLATWVLFAAWPLPGRNWRSDLIFLAVLGFGASSLAAVRISRQVRQRLRHPRLDASPPAPP